MTAKRRILFICTGNSARSQIAEALLRHQAADFFEVHSAGTRPAPIDLRAIEALQRQGIEVRGLESKRLDAVFKGLPFDFVITLCDKALQECSNVEGIAETLHWDVVDPKTRTDPDPFHKTVLELSERIKMFVLIKTKKG